MLILSQANISTSTLSWNYGEHSDFIVGKILLSFSLEVSMTNSDLFFVLMVAGLLPNSWVNLFYIAHGFNFLLFSRSILHLRCIGFACWFDLGD